MSGLTMQAPTTVVRLQAWRAAFASFWAKWRHLVAGRRKGRQQAAAQTWRILRVRMKGKKNKQKMTKIYILYRYLIVDLLRSLHYRVVNCCIEAILSGTTYRRVRTLLLLMCFIE